MHKDKQKSMILNQIKRINYLIKELRNNKLTTKKYYVILKDLVLKRAELLAQV